MDGQISQQSSSYRQGLVLGLTMAEIMILLIFCLLITMATFLKREQTKREQAEEMVRVERVRGEADRTLVEAIEQSLLERIQRARARARARVWKWGARSHGSVQGGPFISTPALSGGCR